MANGHDDERRALEGPLLEIDSELNIFSLANGLDLLKNRSDAPDRVLEWYRDGMERRIVIRVEGPERLSVSVGASTKRGGVRRAALVPLGDAVSPAELKERLRPTLAEGIEAANSLAEADLSPA